MGERPWDVWRETDSLLEWFIDGKRVRLEGTGILELEEEEGAWKSGADKGPGQVNFVLLCDFEDFKSPHADTIQIELVSRDDAAFSIMRGKGDDRPFRPLPWYQLTGLVSVDQKEVPIQMGAVVIDDRTPAPLCITKEKRR